MKTKNISFLIVYSIFLISGIAGLISEIAWNSMIVLIAGNTVFASSLVVMAFMSGLACGSFAGARFLSKRNPSIAPYVVLELLIGIYVLLSPFIFNFISNNLFAIAQGFFNTNLLFVFRLIISFAFLFFPSLLMGASFPAILLFLSDLQSEKQTAHSGYLYGINTVGAAAGAILSGYVLLPYLGKPLTLVVAGSLNMLAVFGACVVNYLNKKNAENNVKAKEIFAESKESKFLHVNKIFILAVFISGFVSLSYQMIMIRVITLLFGNRVEIFSLVVASFLVGTGLSALIGTKLFGLVKRTESLFATMIIFAGSFLILSPFMLAGLPSIPFRWMFGRVGFQAMIFIVILMPVLFSGCLLPIAIKIFEKGNKLNASYYAGKLYAINTFGAVLGAGITNYFLISLLGTPGLISIYAFIFIAIGLYLFWMSNNTRKIVLLMFFFFLFNFFRITTDNFAFHLQ